MLFVTHTCQELCVRNRTRKILLRLHFNINKNNAGEFMAHVCSMCRTNIRFVFITLSFDLGLQLELTTFEPTNNTTRAMDICFNVVFVSVSKSNSHGASSIMKNNKRQTFYLRYEYSLALRWCQHRSGTISRR